VYGDFVDWAISPVLLGCIIIMAADRLYLPQLAQVLKSLNTSVLPNTNPALKDFLATSVDPIQMRLFLFGLTLVMMIIRPEGLVPSKERQANFYEAVMSLWQKQGADATVRSVVPTH